jgi:hypothetical protein
VPPQTPPSRTTTATVPEGKFAKLGAIATTLGVFVAIVGVLVAVAPDRHWWPFSSPQRLDSFNPNLYTLHSVVVRRDMHQSQSTNHTGD